jgi:hypothetical protein
MRKIFFIKTSLIATLILGCSSVWGMETVHKAAPEHARIEITPNTDINKSRTTQETKRKSMPSQEATTPKPTSIIGSTFEQIKDAPNPLDVREKAAAQEKKDFEEATYMPHTGYKDPKLVVPLKPLPMGEKLESKPKTEIAPTVSSVKSEITIPKLKSLPVTEEHLTGPSESNVELQGSSKSEVGPEEALPTPISSKYLANLARQQHNPRLNLKKKNPKRILQIKKNHCLINCSKKMIP